MFLLKTCPKCRGDLFLENDSDSHFMNCLQCGRRIYLEEDKIDDLEVIDFASLSASAELSHSTSQELVLA